MAMHLPERGRPGGGELVTPREAREADPGPTWIRLTAASWAMIREEYLAGATAKQLALKWGTSPTSIYRHACQEGWTKENYAQALEESALTHAEAEAAAKHERETSTISPGSPVDGEQVAALALGAAARCIAAGRFAEAERLGKLAETLSRLGHSNGAGGAGGAWRGGLDADRVKAPELPPKDEPFMTPGETKRSPYQMERMRALVEYRFERLAARFAPKTPRPDPQDLDPENLAYGDAP